MSFQYQNKSNITLFVSVYDLGGLIAATWAALMNFGLDGYVEMTKGIFSTLDFIVQGQGITKKYYSLKVGLMTAN